jgi:hypothetical protein
MIGNMHKYALALILCALAVSASAEIEGWGVGVGVFDGDFGFQGRKDFGLDPKGVSEISLQGSVYFHNRTTFRFDADYHHVLTPGESLLVYPLGGLQFAVNSRNNRFGLNLGGGMNFDINERLEGFVELKYTFGDWDGFGIAAGVRF